MIGACCGALGATTGAMHPQPPGAARQAGVHPQLLPRRRQHAAHRAAGRRRARCACGGCCATHVCLARGVRAASVRQGTPAWPERSSYRRHSAGGLRRWPHPSLHPPCSRRRRRLHAAAHPGGAARAARAAGLQHCVHRALPHAQQDARGGGLLLCAAGGGRGLGGRGVGCGCMCACAGTTGGRVRATLCGWKPCHTPTDPPTYACGLAAHSAARRRLSSPRTRRRCMACRPTSS